MSGLAEFDQQLAGSWEVNATAWTRSVREGRIESRRLATDAAILDTVLRHSPRRVLDVGCGEGWLCRALSPHVAEVVGVDGSAPLIDAARVEGGGRYHLLSYEELATDPTRLGETGFDAVICNFALLQEEITPLLRALHALLHPTGVLVIQTVHPWSARGKGPYADGWRVEHFAAFGGEFPEPMPWYFRTLGSWIGVLSGAGFGVEETTEPIHPESGDPLSLLLAARCR